MNYFLPNASWMGLDTGDCERQAPICETMGSTPGGSWPSSSMQLMGKREGDYSISGGTEGHCSRKLSVIIISFAASALLLGV